MKRENKGFTLVEILIVIAIIGIITAIAVPSIMGISKKMKERGFESKIESIEKATVNFVQDNANKIKEKYSSTLSCIGEECNYKFTMTVKDLIELDAYDSENKEDTCNVHNPYDESKCLDCTEIEITLDDKYKTSTARVIRPDEDKYLLNVDDAICNVFDLN